MVYSIAITQDGQFVALYGQEFSSISSGNHVNVFDVPHVIDDNAVPNGDYAALLNTWLCGQVIVHLMDRGVRPSFFGSALNGEPFESA